MRTWWIATLAVAGGIGVLIPQAEGGAAVPVQRVSVSSSGVQGNQGVNGLGSSEGVQPGVSQDGRYVVFSSDSTNLVPGDTNGTTDIFVRDVVKGITERVNVSQSGGQATDGSWTGGSISGSGRYVAFGSSASNLVPGDTNKAPDVFVRDRVAHTTILVSRSSTGQLGNGYSAEPVISTNGRYVAFFSEATNLVPHDTNRWGDVFVRDLKTNRTGRVSIRGTAGHPVQANGISRFPSISADGRYVAFGSMASNLVPGDTGRAADIFIRDRARAVTRRVSIGLGGREGNKQSFGSTSVSATGRFVAFPSRASNLVPGDTNGVTDIFVRDRVRGVTIRASVAGRSTQRRYESTNPAISNSGRRITFRLALVGIILRDLPSRTDHVVAQSVGPAGISADGRFVAFPSSATNLVPGDTNGAFDTFLYGPQP